MFYKKISNFKLISKMIIIDRISSQLGTAAWLAGKVTTGGYPIDQNVCVIWR